MELIKGGVSEHVGGCDCWCYQKGLIPSRSHLNECEVKWELQKTFQPKYHLAKLRIGWFYELLGEGNESASPTRNQASACWEAGIPLPSQGAQATTVAPGFGSWEAQGWGAVCLPTPNALPKLLRNRWPEVRHLRRQASRRQGCLEGTTCMEPFTNHSPAGRGSGTAPRGRRHGRYSCPCGWWSPW